MKLLNWVKYGNTINLIILMKLLKGKYTSLYTAIHVSKQFSFIMIFMFPNNFNVYFSFNNIDILKRLYTMGKNW